jgi:hypothetical protein
MSGNRNMKSSLLSLLKFLIIIFVLLSACDIVTVEVDTPEPVIEKGVKPNIPVQLGWIAAYFGDDYKIFSESIEKVAPVDSFTCCYFYSYGKYSQKQINLIRCDSKYVVAIYINGVSPDSLPPSRPVPQQFGRYAEIHFFPFSDWNSTSPNHYYIESFYGNNVFITSSTDDVLTGTFEGVLRTPGKLVSVTEGEFKLKIFRKNMSVR